MYIYIYIYVFKAYKDVRDAVEQGFGTRDRRVATVGRLVRRTAVS